jgi:hypothetical protein
MRSLIVIGMFAATLTHAAWNGYTEDRSLELDSEGVSQLGIDAGAGKLVVNGTDGEGRIIVEATINVPGENDEDALRTIEKHLRLTLDKVGDEARLVADFEQQFWKWNDSPSVDLDVRVPRGIALFVDDGSGSIEIAGLNSDVAIDDGSGSIRVEQVRSVVIDDGSGSIIVSGVAGNVDIEDGSGSINVEHVGGGVRIDDGSGSIDVSDIEADLGIEDDGSGGLKAADVRGDVIDES